MCILVHAWYLNTQWEAEAADSGVLGQFGLYSKTLSQKQNQTPLPIAVSQCMYSYHTWYQVTRWPLRFFTFLYKQFSTKSFSKESLFFAV